MASNIPQALLGRPLHSQHQELKVFYADSEFSPEEGRFVFTYTGRAGDLTLVRNRSDAEHLLVVILKTAEGGENLKPRHAGELKLLKFLLAPKVGYAHIGSRSRLDAGGDRYLTFDYGPALDKRQSTPGYELGKVLALMGCRSVARVEMGRHFVTKTAQYIGEDQMRTLHRALANDLSTQRYVMLQRATGANVPVTVLTPQAERGEFHLRDPVSIYLMLPGAHNATPLGIQASTAANPLVRQYIILTTRSSMSVFPWGLAPKNPSVRNALTHLHSEASSMGRPQLLGPAYQLSLLPFNRVTGAACGLYSVTPSVASGYEASVHAEIRDTYEAQARCLNHTGVPVVSGFLRTFDETSTCLAYNTLMCTSTLATCPVNMLTTSRFLAGQYIVSLGDFLPVGGPDAPPYLYRSSPFLSNAIANTLKLFGKTWARICISSTSRQVGFASSLADFSALLPKGGAVLYLSKLPREVIDPIRGRGATREGLLDHINKFYLRVASNQTLVVLKDGRVGAQGKQGYEFLRKAASLNGCTFRVLGRTCEEAGLHFFDDLNGEGEEVSPKRMGYSPQGAAFSVYFDDPTKKITREYAEGADVRESMVLVREGILDWDIFLPFATVHSILAHPTVASKEFFVRRVDRCGNGLVRQQPGVGAWDLPLADYSLIVDPVVSSFSGMSFSLEVHEAAAPLENISVSEARSLAEDPEWWFGGASANNKEGPEPPLFGHILACGEQGYKMINNSILGAQYGVAELLTNMMLGPEFSLSKLQISAAVHWNEGPDYRAQLERAVMACKQFCAELGVNLAFTSGCSSGKYEGPQASPPGPDSLNLISFCGKAQVNTAAPRLTPELHGEGHVLVHLSVNREVVISGSVFEHKMTGLKHPLPPLDAARLRDMFQCVQALTARGLVTAGHDVSDGGLVTCCIEMALAGGCGITLEVDPRIPPLPVLFSESPGVVLEVPQTKLESVLQLCEFFRCFANRVGAVEAGGREARVSVMHGGTEVFGDSLSSLLNSWTSFSDEQYSKHGANLREAEMYRKDYGDNEIDLGSLEPLCASSQLALFRSPDHPVGAAVLCLPGCPQPLAMMKALVHAGFVVSVLGVDDLVASRDGLGAFKVLTVSGVSGFPDNYPACRGLVQSLLANPAAGNALRLFLSRRDTFSLGCGELGVEFLSAFGVFEIPTLERRGERGEEHGSGDVGGAGEAAAAGDGGNGAAGEAAGGLTTTDTGYERRSLDLEANASELPECLWLNFRVPWATASVALRHLAGTVLPCWVYGTHLGIRYRTDGLEYSLDALGMIALHYHGRRSQDWNFARHYPRNPAAVSTVAGLCSRDGRHTGLLCDPSVASHSWQWQHIPQKVAPLKTSPWAVMFHTLYLHCLKDIN
nr:tegument protein G75 [Equid gammaherpesvirus 5]